MTIVLCISMIENGNLVALFFFIKDHWKYYIVIYLEYFYLLWYSNEAENRKVLFS